MSTSPRTREPSSAHKSDDARPIPEALFKAVDNELLRIYNNDLRGADTFIFPFTPYSTERVDLPIRAAARRGADEQSDATFVRGVAFALIGYQIHRVFDAGSPKADTASVDRVTSRFSASVDRVVGRFSVKFKNGSLDAKFEVPNLRRSTYKSFHLNVDSTDNYNCDDESESDAVTRIEDATTLSKSQCSDLQSTFKTAFAEMAFWRSADV